MVLKPTANIFFLSIQLVKWYHPAVFIPSRGGGESLFLWEADGQCAPHTKLCNLKPFFCLRINYQPAFCSEGFPVPWEASPEPIVSTIAGTAAFRWVLILGAYFKILKRLVRRTKPFRPEHFRGPLAKKTPKKRAIWARAGWANGFLNVQKNDAFRNQIMAKMSLSYWTEVSGHESITEALEHTDTHTHTKSSVFFQRFWMH